MRLFGEEVVGIVGVCLVGLGVVGSSCVESRELGDF